MIFEGSYRHQRLPNRPRRSPHWQGVGNFDVIIHKMYGKRLRLIFQSHARIAKDVVTEMMWRLVGE